MSRVLTLAPMPPEKLAYALARYSRSPDSIRDSIDWVRSHDSGKFLESFYFQYGHASIADLGHLAICFEGVSELAATEIEDEQLWDGQARSSRYQDFSKSGYISPPELSESDSGIYRAIADSLLAAYADVHERMRQWYEDKLPRPEEMKPEAYKRNIAARAFDVARYCLFFGIPTGVGQVVSIRTLEKQIRRLKASPYQEVRDIGNEIAFKCTEPAACNWSSGDSDDPIAPTLARFVDADQYPAQAKQDLRQWAAQNLPSARTDRFEDIDLMRPADILADVAACLLYEVTSRSYRELYETLLSWNEARRMEVLDVALRSRTRRDEMLRSFRGGPYVYDIVMDVGAYRDMHRHRRCIAIAAGLWNRSRRRHSSARNRSRRRGIVAVGSGRSVKRGPALATSSSGLCTSVCNPRAFPFQNGLCGSRIHLSLTVRRERPLQLSSCCVGNEMRNGETRTGVRTFNIGNFTLGRRSPQAVNSSTDAWGISL